MILVTEINISKKIYDIVGEHPDIVEIMTELGFTDITKPGMLQSAGKIMTLEKGAKLKKIPFDKIVEAFKRHGYSVVKEK